MKGFFIWGLCVSPVVFFAQIQKDSIKEKQIQEVSFTKRLPMTKEIINVQKDLEQKNLGQDLPILLKNQTAVVTTSDAGNGVGYTGFRIRGVGGTAINVMMNGVPYNDSESQGTFFVDVPDLASSASQIVIQRGVGTSSNGVSAFGASVNVVSKDPKEQFYVATDDSYGSFNTYKYAAEMGSGKFWNNRLSLMGRYTKIHSDGYVDRASSQLDSYNFSALFEENKTRIRFLAFGGKEKTYQAWYGISKTTWESQPRFNFSGAIFSKTGEITGFYDNETDNYKQKHYQLLWNQTINNNWNLETTLHYTDGKGYYENYKQDSKLSKYNLPNQDGIAKTDLIRKKWLDNDFYGGIATLYGKFDGLDFNMGLVANQYYGRHYGNVTGVTLKNIQEHEYYRNRSVKNEVAGFAKAIVKFDDFEFFGDVQLRRITYDTKIILAGADEGKNMDKKWLFFNPKAGVSYYIPSGKVFLSYAHAHREPNRDDLFANIGTEAEKLHDFEAGVEKSFGKLLFSANAYYMNYVNQLVLTGEINDVGTFIRRNSGESYRMGVELSALAKISKYFEITGNMAFSENKNKNFKIEKGNKTINLGNTPISFSPNMTANLLLNVAPTDRFSFGIQNKYVGSQFLDNTNHENLKLKDYFLTDFNAKYTLNLKPVDVDFKLLINNVFDKKYVSNGYVDGEVYVFPQAGINFMFGMSLMIK